MTLPADKPPQLPRLVLIRPFTSNVFNRLSRHFAGWMPLLGILEVPGRKSGLVYRTPLNVFHDGEDWIVALTYGSDVQWLKNVMAAGGCRLVSRRKTHVLVNPRVFVDRSRHLMPFPVRQFLGLLRVSEFLRLSPVTRS